MAGEQPGKKVKRPTEPRGRVRYLNEEEREKAAEGLPGKREPVSLYIVVLAISTGNAPRGNNGADLGRCGPGTAPDHPQQTKNDERRAVPIVGAAFDLLKACPRCADWTAVCSSPGAIRKSRSKFAIPGLAALEKAGVGDFRFHDLRHTAASYLAMNGATLAEIAEILGHKTFQMVKRYAHLSEAHTASVVEKMNAKIFG